MTSCKFRPLRHQNIFETTILLQISYKHHKNRNKVEQMCCKGRAAPSKVVSGTRHTASLISLAMVIWNNEKTRILTPSIGIFIKNWNGIARQPKQITKYNVNYNLWVSFIALRSIGKVGVYYLHNRHKRSMTSIWAWHKKPKM